MNLRNKLICGVDEAGRGPVIGPLVIGFVSLDDEGRERLKELGVRDSKRVSKKRRIELEPIIKETAREWKTVKIKAREIDFLRKRHSLNQIEAMKIAETLLELEHKPKMVIVDSIDSIANDYKKRIIHCINSLRKEFEVPEIISEHRADDKYIEVSAASIIAKVERDREIEKIKEQYGDFGSGYPADELTREFIRKLIRCGELPEFVRRSWNTLDRGRQTNLSDF
ncbi:MAG: ribonuclease HII [Candidatus Altiarchaeales archaeon]|nr:MAG: ribonuclease HII [Candidatus Altiarchaeales archaeon]RLI94476.1 MAG: ribonuclease HII [Candidatus Altiarchaeales archaeon]RLI94486.1 MAG: ribonuclease HII [Candidatus Altiarchaeales archaeon]HDO82302.1 ribonuclease HII [Candidatus Altiarchaeales archaeon]HEX54951.1 ribonuclease HII [Candidatus Altiarchaeales archaeon]